MCRSNSGSHDPRLSPTHKSFARVEAEHWLWKRKLVLVINNQVFLFQRLFIHVWLPSGTIDKNILYKYLLKRCVGSCLHCLTGATPMDMDKIKRLHSNHEKNWGITNLEVSKRSSTRVEYYSFWKPLNQHLNRPN